MVPGPGSIVGESQYPTQIKQAGLEWDERIEM